jgi:glycosyltransferase involved in cell wall biosynthesis
VKTAIKGETPENLKITHKHCNPCYTVAPPGIQIIKNLRNKMPSSTINNENNPLVSVIIPTYNRAAYIKRCLESVLTQTYSNLEIIVIDDNSEDNTEEIIKNYNDERIKYIKRTGKRGVCQARNEAIKASKGEYIIFQDSDDVYLPQKIEKHLQSFKDKDNREKIGAVHSAWWKLKENPNEKISFPVTIPDDKIRLPLNKVSVKEGNILESLFTFHNFISIQTMVKRKVLEETGLFDETLPRLEDWDLWIKIAEKYDFVYIDEPLHLVYVTPSCRSSGFKEIADSSEMILKKHYNIIKHNKNILTALYFCIAHYSVLGGNIKNGRKYYLKSFIQNPSNFKYALFYLLTLTGKKFYTSIMNLKNAIPER